MSGINPVHEADHLIVDTTSTRVRTGDVQFYSGYKKQRVVKVQVICCDKGVVRHVSNHYPGSIHDKRIWDLEFPGIPRHHAILADCAYAGALGDGSFLHRPVRKNEKAYKADTFKAKEQNRRLSLKRVKIEHLFARLKTWRIIHHYFPQHPETFSTVFKAIAYIHNQMVLERLGELYNKPDILCIARARTSSSERPTIGKASLGTYMRCVGSLITGTA